MELNKKTMQRIMLLITFTMFFSGGMIPTYLLVSKTLHLTNSWWAVILVGGIVANGLKGAGKALKDFSLPISMSFRMFGALLSGLLVTELVYYYVSLSFVVPVVVGVLFTLLHALIQAYVLTTLTSMFYGETTEKHAPKPKKNKKIKAEAVNN